MRNVPCFLSTPAICSALHFLRSSRATSAISSTVKCGRRRHRRRRACVAVRFLGAVLAIVVGRIAPQFAADRAAVAPEKLSDVRLRAAAHELRGNRVSFFLGELVIRHGCNPFTGRMERRQYHWLPTLVQSALHLLCESARPLKKHIAR